MPAFQKVPQNVIDTVRMLSVDAIQKANSGHPGTPMGAAEMTLTLWAHFLRFDPQHPEWKDRDRFVLSVGHASMLLYSLLHLFEYDVTLEDIKKFRQMGSRTAGHPEYGHLPGIETTTGPLGQGVSNSVGMALGQALMAGKYNSAEQKVVQGHVWCLAGDGCMMEGIAYESASLAGHLGLNNLTLIYDKNDVTIDGSAEITFTEDVAARFEAMHWRVIKVSAYDQAALCDAYAQARSSQDKPTLIVAQSVIGRGSATLEGSSATHGAALGEKEVEATKKKLGWPLEPFYVSDAVRQWCHERVTDKTREREAWDKSYAGWAQANTALALEYQRQWAQPLPADLDKKVLTALGAEKAATRKSSGKAIQVLAKELPWLIGGSADLAESNNSPIKDAMAVRRGPRGVFEGRNIFFGVREHAMAGICNGLALHGAWHPYCATFLQFADYMRPSIRLAALMGLKTTFVFTHDSIFLGEDGPTHQPVEHVSALRLIPGLTVWRPADGAETGMAWTWAIAKAKGPVALALTRQNTAPLPFASDFDARDIWKGGYVLKEAPNADLTLIATGSEMSAALDAAKGLAEAGISVRMVSMPSLCEFGRQDAVWREKVLGSAPRVVIEAGSPDLWAHHVGSQALIIGVKGFGLSAPADDLARHFGLTPPQIIETVKAWLPTAAKVRV